MRAILLLLMLSFLGGCAIAPTQLRAGAEPVRAGAVPRFDVFEVVLTASSSYANPFTDVGIVVTFGSPDGRERTVPAFHDGGSTWRARFAPDTPGKWTYRTVASVTADTGLHGASGAFDCIGSASKGFIRPDPTSPYWFAFSDGSPFFGIGDTSYGLASGVSDALALRYLDKRASQGFNFVRLFAAGFPFLDERQLPAEAGFPWGGTPESPDYDRINPKYFQRLERLLAEMARRDMYAEVLVFNYYSMPFIDPTLWTPAREELWSRQVIARLAAFRSVFLWTVTNEYETYPAGKYKYDGASDDDWAKRMGAAIQRLDAQRHPVSVHNVTFDSDGGIGGRFGAGTDITVLSQQSWGDATWSKKYLQGNALGIERTVYADRKYGKPVVNTENGYEWLPRHSNFNEQTVSTDKARRAAWRVFMAGGAAYAAGFGGTWHGSHDYMWKGDGPLLFRLQDSGLGSQIGHLRDFVEATPYTTMSPARDRCDAPSLCLAGTDEFIAYAPDGGAITVDLSTQGGSYFQASRFDTRTGKTRRLPNAPGGGKVTFQGPKASDWALRLRKVERSGSR